MPGEDFYVDTAGLNEALTQVRHLGARLEAVQQGLMSRLEGLGECWGDDEGGRQFLEEYAKPRKQLVEGTASLAKAVESVHEGVRTMAVNLERLEERNIEAARALRGHGIDTPRTSGGKNARS
ncbi:WXG100 family type VII secretion target [Streptomyces griseoluteus]|uniref:WXG100 family type VII secretion target n=1 Tax=Streptomyces griseoluteus TaxID=29306 RepID=UPI00380068C4